MEEYNKSGKLKISKQKYKSTDKGRATIKSYTASTKNKQLQKEYRQSDHGRITCIFKLAKYRAIQKQAMPSWTDLKYLRLLYKACPKELEVDHIIPLQGENISGLHVPWNIQYLTREQNAFKSNKFDGTRDNNSWMYT